MWGMGKLLAGIVLWGIAIVPASARLMKDWSPDELFSQSTLVVWAHPDATRDTAEAIPLPGMPQLEAIGVETDFEVEGVFKGDRSLKTLVLHHYRLRRPNQGIVNGPGLVRFDPAASSSYLLFVVREADGRFAPVAGQIDPDLSIIRLDRR